MPEERIRGTISKVHPSGWGFIQSKDQAFTRFFFHWTALRNTTLNFTELKPRMVVEFEPVHYIDKKTDEDKGWRAYDIEVIENAIQEAETEPLGEK